MKAITFLGVRPQTALYTMSGKEHAASQFGVALARFIPNLTLRALVTKKAMDEQYPAFEREVEDYVADVRAVPITDGRDADELWELFDSVVDQIEEDEEVIFDITHGFRSLPFLAFLAAAYVRIVKRAQIKGVYYANYDAGFGDPRQVPVVDLTEFVALLDWMIAADLFSKRGDSSRLADLMRTDLRNMSPAQRQLHREAPSSKMVTSMNNVSSSLRLIRPEEVMEASHELITHLEQGADEFARSARPFVPLLNQVADAYRPLALADPRDDLYAALAIERELVAWYLDRGYLVQATAVAREWLVTWALLQQGVTSIYNRALRIEMEHAITAQQVQHRSQPRASSVNIAHMTHIEELADLYEKLAHVRNDLLHAGKNASPMEGGTLEKNIRKYCDKLADFPLPTPKPTSP